MTQNPKLRDWDLELSAMRHFSLTDELDRRRAFRAQEQPVSANQRQRKKPEHPRRDVGCASGDCRQSSWVAAY